MSSLPDRMSRSQDEFGLEPRALRIVIAIMAAERVGLPPSNADQASDVAEVSRGAYPLGRLVAKRWLVVVGYMPGKGSRPLYRAHTRAWTVLGFERPAQSIRRLTGDSLNDTSRQCATR